MKLLALDMTLTSHVIFSLISYYKKINKHLEKLKEFYNEHQIPPPTLYRKHFTLLRISLSIFYSSIKLFYLFIYFWAFQSTLKTLEYFALNTSVYISSIFF